VKRFKANCGFFVFGEKMLGASYGGSIEEDMSHIAKRISTGAVQMRRRKMRLSSWTVVLAFIMLFAFVHRALAIRENDTSRDTVEVLVPERDMGPTSPLATRTRREDQCSFSGGQNRVNAFRVRACNLL
jgi:hypothetical protein